jgi:hypothetical protein
LKCCRSVVGSDLESLLPPSSSREPKRFTATLSFYGVPDAKASSALRTQIHAMQFVRQNSLVHALTTPPPSPPPPRPHYPHHTRVACGCQMDGVCAMRVCYVCGWSMVSCSVLKAPSLSCAHSIARVVHVCCVECHTLSIRVAFFDFGLCLFWVDCLTRCCKHFLMTIRV